MSRLLRNIGGAADTNETLTKSGSGMLISMRLGLQQSWPLWKMGMAMLMDMKEYRLTDADLDTQIGSITMFAERKIDFL